MEDLKKSRRIQRSRLTCHAKHIDSTLQEDDTPVEGLEQLLQEYNSKVRDLQDTHESLQVHCEEVDDLTGIIEEQFNFITPKDAIKFKLMQKIQTLKNQRTKTITHPAPQDHEGSEGGAEGSMLGQYRTKLPKLVIDPFSGDFAKWPHFSETYIHSIHNMDIPGSVKFSYLVSYLRGDALEVVQGYAMDDKSYEDAWQQLQLTYGSTERLSLRYISALLHMESAAKGKEPSPHHVKALHKLYNSITMNLRSLQNLGEVSAQTIYVPFV